MNIVCWFFGHKTKKIATLTREFDLTMCKRCRKVFVVTCYGEELGEANDEILEFCKPCTISLDKIKDLISERKRECTLTG